MTVASKPQALVPHPAAPAPEGLRVESEASRSATGNLSVRFLLEGPLDLVRIPPPRPASFVNGLWRHTCFEVFLGLAEGPAYHEWNLSPSGEWAAHVFSGYREGGLVADERLAPAIAVRHTRDRLELAATVPLGAVSPHHAAAVLRIGLSAVVESRDGALSWWALRHPPGKPDFHHADAFALRLEPPRA